MGTERRADRRRRVSLRMKLLLFMIPLALAASGLMGWASHRVALAVLTEKLGRRADAMASAIALHPGVEAGLRRRSEALVLPELQHLLQAGAVYAAALDAEGAVVAHSNLLEKGKIYRDGDAGGRRVETPTGPALEAAVPVWAAGAQGAEEFVLEGGRRQRRRLGTVLVALPLAETLETATRISGQVVWALAAINAVFFAVLLAFLNRLVRPLRVLAGAAERLGSGRLGETVPVSSSDELGELARSFNRMSLQLGRITVSKDILDAKVAELARSNQELEEYAFVASHDLQEPLRKIVGFTELLSRRYQGRLDADADRHLRYVIAAAGRMQALIKDILSLSRAGHETLAREPVDLDEALSEVLSLLDPELREAGARVTRGSLPTIAGDGRLLRLLLQNLLSNAVKFRRAEPPAVHVSARDEGERWVLSVRDNGVGIEPCHLDRIFKMFQRLRRDAPGTGVGLALCKKVVERHGGRIWAESAVGVGTTIHFALPKLSPPREGA